MKIYPALKRISVLKIGVVSFRALKNKHGFPTKLRLLLAFFSDYHSYRKLDANKRFALKTEDLYPRIYDKTAVTPIDPVYFYQDAWCAKKIFEARPARHYDIGSEAGMIGIISQFTPTIMIDIRPLKLSIPGLSFIKGSILELPFKDNEISSLSLRSAYLSTSDLVDMVTRLISSDPRKHSKRWFEYLRLVVHSISQSPSIIVIGCISMRTVHSQGITYLN